MFYFTCCAQQKTFFRAKLRVLASLRTFLKQHLMQGKLCNRQYHSSLGYPVLAFGVNCDQLKYQVDLVSPSFIISLTDLMRLIAQVSSSFKGLFTNQVNSRFTITDFYNTKYFLLSVLQSSYVLKAYTLCP